jgi:D-3-phosphoglycerate dehydrogenase
MTKLAVIEMSTDPGRDLGIERSVLGDGIDIEQIFSTGEAASIVEACHDADLVLTDYVPFTRDVLEQLPHLRLISVAATGFDCIDVEAAHDHSIFVAAIDEYCTDEVADHALMLMLALAKRLMFYHDAVQNKHRWKFDSLSGLPRFGELTLGIIGYGRIGRAVVKRAEAFGMSVLAFDPYADDATAFLDDVLAKSDIISLHCALSPDTRHMIDARAFSKMQRSPILINVARGGLIAEADLASALDEGIVSAAGLDVLEDEPPDLANSTLVGRSNVILTPHMAFYSDASIRENRTLSAQNIRHFLAGNHDAVRKYVCKPDMPL